MLEQIRSNMIVNFKFYLRNRLLLVIGLLFLGMTALSTIPAFFMSSSNQTFTILKTLFMQLNSFTMVFTAGMGLFIVSTHLKNRSIKMVLTKPCLPEVWLVSAFLSAMAISFALNIMILSFAFIFSLSMGIPFQDGYIFISMDYLIKSIILLSYIMFLAMVFHPVMAVLVVSIFNEGTFYGLKTMLMAVSKSNSGWYLVALEKVAGIMYMLMPITSPLASEKTGSIYSSLRVANPDWGNLVNAAVYTLAITWLFFLLSDRSLRNKTLI